MFGEIRGYGLESPESSFGFGIFGSGLSGFCDLEICPEGIPLGYFSQIQNLSNSNTSVTRFEQRTSNIPPELPP